MKNGSIERVRHAAPEPETAQGEGEVYTIGDLAREFGVTLRTLRFYEDRGLLSPKRQGSARLYGARDRKRLGVILEGKQLGFTLTEIRAMLDDEDGDAVLPLTRQQIDEQIAHLENQRTEVEQALAELRARRQSLAG
ncbi:MAG TPA: MerR family DNA-binding transcriptional regulator [Beijerinckiaceae bacterium]|nr:MerR family DNA-binding transcriptional regulator [Beijerinckiaceae bacterium]